MSLSKLKPLQIIVLVFLVLIGVGGTLLMLPVSSYYGNVTDPLTAYFTAISSVTVTGLTLVDTGGYWSTFGQAVILALIEVGGLGFMTFVVSIFLIFNQKLSLKSRMIIKESYNLSSYFNINTIMSNIIAISLIFQAIGAILLGVAFVPKYGWEEGIWYSIFHAVSAYCNSGFDLFGDSLMQFSKDPYVMLVFAALIILGSFGFIVFIDVINYRVDKKVTLHTKLALTMTCGLLAIGTLLFAVTDIDKYNGDPFLYLVQSFFLSVSQRTAGFSIHGSSYLSYAGIFVTMLLMVVGGTSGSTAGGLKTTTLGILLLDIKSSFRQRKYTTYKKRTIPKVIVTEAYESVFIYMAVVMAASLILLVTEQGHITGVDDVLFEVISALSTVGLTMGVTTNLSIFGKVLICILMFVGRVGVFTVVYSLNQKEPGEDLYKYPEEKVMVG
jgi:trk system potassium uptake protein TrkH